MTKVYSLQALADTVEFLCDHAQKSAPPRIHEGQLKLRTEHARQVVEMFRDARMRAAIEKALAEASEAT